MKDSADALVARMRSYAIEVLADGEYPKALRWLVAAKDLEQFFRYESTLGWGLTREGDK